MFLVVIFVQIAFGPLRCNIGLKFNVSFECLMKIKNKLLTFLTIYVVCDSMLTLTCTDITIKGNQERFTLPAVLFSVPKVNIKKL